MSHPVHERARPGAMLPRPVFERVDGPAVDIGGERERWTLLVVYRGRHCDGPAARADLAELLDGMRHTIANDEPPRGTSGTA